MSDHKPLTERIYTRLNTWLVDVKSHEFENIIELVEQAKLYAAAAEHLSEEKLNQFIANLEYDLKEFYLLNKNQAQQSLYLALLKESFWQHLAKITDQTQLQWSELLDDFQHQGCYQRGDIIGFGTLECEHCHNRQIISHLTSVTQCIHCQGEHFIRLPYKG